MNVYYWKILTGWDNSIFKSRDYYIVCIGNELEEVREILKNSLDEIMIHVNKYNNIMYDDGRILYVFIEYEEEKDKNELKPILENFPSYAKKDAKNWTRLGVRKIQEIKEKIFGEEPCNVVKVPEDFEKDEGIFIRIC
jgi:hypothetical protein